MKTWKAKIKIGGKGSWVETQVQANSSYDAKQLILGQYPAGTQIMSGPTEVR